MRTRFIAAAVIICVAIGVLGANTALLQMGACNKPEHYEVSHVRGRVVGKSLGLLQFRWLRRRFAGASADLQLLTHQVPYRTGAPYGFVRAMAADQSGLFDFGDVPPGEYALSVHLIPNEAGIMFHFAVNPNMRTRGILIDASPAPYCDCCGWDFEAR